VATSSPTPASRGTTTTPAAPRSPATFGGLGTAVGGAVGGDSALRGAADAGQEFMRPVFTTQAAGGALANFSGAELLPPGHAGESDGSLSFPSGHGAGGALVFSSGDGDDGDAPAARTSFSQFRRRSGGSDGGAARGHQRTANGAEELTHQAARRSQPSPALSGGSRETLEMESPTGRPDMWPATDRATPPEFPAANSRCVACGDGGPSLWRGLDGSLAHPECVTASSWSPAAADFALVAGPGWVPQEGAWVPVRLQPLTRGTPLRTTDEVAVTLEVWADLRPMGEVRVQAGVWGVWVHSTGPGVQLPQDVVLGGARRAAGVGAQRSDMAATPWLGGGDGAGARSESPLPPPPVLGLWGSLPQSVLRSGRASQREVPRAASGVPAGLTAVPVSRSPRRESPRLAEHAGVGAAVLTCTGCGGGTAPLMQTTGGAWAHYGCVVRPPLGSLPVEYVIVADAAQVSALGSWVPVTVRPEGGRAEPHLLDRVIANPKPGWGCSWAMTFAGRRRDGWRG
jgi:hypothetical protein